MEKATIELSIYVDYTKGYAGEPVDKVVLEENAGFNTFACNNEKHSEALRVLGHAACHEGEIYLPTWKTNDLIYGYRDNKTLEDIKGLTSYEGTGEIVVVLEYLHCYDGVWLNEEEASEQMYSRMVESRKVNLDDIMLYS